MLVDVQTYIPIMADAKTMENVTRCVFEVRATDIHQRTSSNLSTAKISLSVSTGEQN
jgi:hypothetical protein